MLTNRIVDYFKYPGEIFKLLDLDLNVVGASDKLEGVIYYMYHYENILASFNNPNLYGVCLTLVSKDTVYYYNHIYCKGDVGNLAVGDAIEITMIDKTVPYPLVTKISSNNLITLKEEIYPYFNFKDYTLNTTKGNYVKSSLWQLIAH